MIRQQAVDGGARVKVTFTVPGSDNGLGVAVAGDFNGWDPGRARLQRRANGNRSTALTLDAGRCYAFRYVDDAGNWFNDEDADEFQSNGLGDVNGIIDLRAPRR